MSFLNLAAAAMPGIIQGQQTRLELDEQDRKRKREDMDRFLAQRQQAMNLALQTGDEGAFQAAVKGTPYEGLSGTSYFAKQREKEDQAKADRHRETQEALLQDEAKIASLIQSGVITPQEGFLRYKALGGQPTTRTVKETKQVDVTKQIPVLGPTRPGETLAPVSKTFKAPLTTTRTEEINQFLNVRKAGKTIVDKVDLGDRVQLLYSDGTSAVEKKGAAPQTFAPSRPEMKIVMRNGKPVWAYPKPGEEAFISASQGGAPKPITELDQQKLINSVTSGAHQDALRAAGAQPRQPDPTLAPPGSPAMLDYEKRAQAWGKKFQDAYSKALANRGYAQTFDGQLVGLGTAGSPATTQPKLTIQDMPQGLGKAEQFQWMLDNLE